MAINNFKELKYKWEKVFYGNDNEFTQYKLISLLGISCYVDSHTEFVAPQQIRERDTKWRTQIYFDGTTMDRFSFWSFNTAEEAMKRCEENLDKMIAKIIVGYTQMIKDATK